MYIRLQKYLKYSVFKKIINHIYFRDIIDFINSINITYRQTDFLQEEYKEKTLLHLISLMETLS